jgi:cytosine/creatinine deaminase
MLQGCRIGHLDRPAIGAWPRAVTSTPAAAMGLAERGVGTLAAGGPADFVLFRGRRYSELLARPQFDRVRRHWRKVSSMS